MTRAASPQTLAGRFPDDFLFGVATASYQIEGAAEADGRKPSIWDAFSHMPGRVKGGDTGDVACDHYNRLEADLDLMADLGAKAYRFSLAWPRLLPDGTGPINEKGFDFYDRLLDGLKSRGIEAFATLYHWDLPLALMGRGGWTDRTTAVAFAEYAGLATRRLGDRLDTIVTFNEPWCSVYLGHLTGVHAPGERSIEAAMSALHVTNLAHGLGVRAIRAERPEIPVGIVLNAMSVMAETEREADLNAEIRANDFHNGVFFGPLFEGAYPASVLQACPDLAESIRDGDLETISQPLDFWGLNYYTPMRVRDDPDSSFPHVATAPAVKPEKTDIGWEIEPRGLSHVVRYLYDRYRLPDFYITENGAADNTEIENGAVSDTMRLDYVSTHLSVAADLVSENYPLKGYFGWSLMDNFEWAEGYSMRFGLVHVDYQTQRRTIKQSGYWYRDLIAAHSGRLISAPRSRGRRDLPRRRW
ncbi:GH1 family beta-glucosidase [Hoeflea sp. YIM 152468]|uniref:GH1 family beta-glucosidase n=1 Tax=Hoeflea sp. YIM 152468 TaxID=3031759 RepID=UPI0023DCDE6B|nr:GH1 family beta-glucosidase [Hoeflea sp. YIM 152468]MDF1609220.1 GH1 family beta-glucosidase [Hoeflea sp. YIM 152468]